MQHLLLRLLACWPIVATAATAPLFEPRDRQPTPAELERLPAVDPDKVAALLREVRAPEEFEVSVFATPPAVNYPVFVAAAPDGTLYVSSDGNGSLDRKPHRGRVLRVRDINRDGVGDEVKAFVPDVDSPRGLVWDHDRLYLLHPPDLSVFHDRDGDGVAETKETLVRGIAFTFQDRPADHSSNGLELGVDGWLYAAIGDFGFLDATAKDGSRLQLRGGGVVRLRPDGSRLELWAEGTRNILEVAVSPLLDGFARDNTNDGGGWDVRFHHFGGMTRHGYPRLFKNFGEEIVQPLADFGGGSGCGAAWIDEAGIPERWNNAAFTADWGREIVYHHRLVPRGASFATEQTEFLKLPRATDLDVDGSGNVYAASWKGASFTWVGPDVGFVVRLEPKNFVPEALPDLQSLGDRDLARLVASPSHTRRLAAQRALLRRGSGTAVRNDPTLLTDLIDDTRRPLSVRVAALFGLEQALGDSAPSVIEPMFDRHPTLQPWILRALSDRSERTNTPRTETFLRGLASAEPRTRKEAILALARLGRTEAAPAILEKTADEDPLVAHVAIEALVRLEAAAICLQAVDRTDTTHPVRSAALRVLRSLHHPQVVSGLISRLENEDSAMRREGIVVALCRLYHREGPWKGDSWGTRPDTRGPYYQPEVWGESPRILEALEARLRDADGPETAAIGREIARHRIPFRGALEKLLTLATSDPGLVPSLAAQLADADDLPPDAVPLLAASVRSEATSAPTRAQAAIALTRSDRPDAWKALLESSERIRQTASENGLAEKARAALLNSPMLDRIHATLEDLAAHGTGPSAVLADGLLLRLAHRKVGAPEAREAAVRALDLGWIDPARRARILRASAEIGDASRASAIVSALDDPHPEVAAAAREAVRKLRIDPQQLKNEANQAKVGDKPVPEIVERVTGLRGDARRGEQLFVQLSCNGCHTVRVEEASKGPFLGTIAQTYRRRELAEAILVPTKTLAQGFVTHHFELADGTELDGFVVREAADSVTIRTVTAEEIRIPVARIAVREKQQRSLMPEGLAAGLTLVEFASLLDYLEALSKGTPVP
ncbi:MAG: hypothetical protein JNL97_07585 [Verrucomicrobiales bacterium]|nr:hypothetical protein [Verrucomicrobiales bacterium]